MDGAFRNFISRGKREEPGMRLRLQETLFRLSSDLTDHAPRAGARLLDAVLIPRNAKRHVPGPGGSFPGSPFRAAKRIKRASQVPGEPYANMPCSPTPTGPPHQAVRCFGVAFRAMDGVGSRDQAISGLHHTACSLPVYASQYRSPGTTQHSVPAAGQALPGGTGYPLGSNDRFPVTLPPFTGFAWRTHGLPEQHPRRLPLCGRVGVTAALGSGRGASSPAVRPFPTRPPTPGSRPTGPSAGRRRLHRGGVRRLLRHRRHRRGPSRSRRIIRGTGHGGTVSRVLNPTAEDHPWRGVRLETRSALRIRAHRAERIPVAAHPVDS